MLTTDGTNTTDRKQRLICAFAPQTFFYRKTQRIFPHGPIISPLVYPLLCRHFASNSHSWGRLTTDLYAAGTSRQNTASLGPPVTPKDKDSITERRSRI